MGERAVQFLSGERVILTGLGLVLALATSWYLRGSPPGQRGEEESSRGPSAGYRDRMVAVLVAGILAVALGAYVAFRVGIPAAALLFTIGFALMIFTTRANRKYQHDSPSLRRLVWFGDAALNGSLLAGVLVVGNVLAFRYGGRPLDLSTDGSYSLESLTTKQLHALEKPLKFLVLSGSSERAMGQLERIRQLLRLFQAENVNLVEVEYLDPYADPTRITDLRKKLGDLSLLEGGGIVVELGRGEDASRLIVRNAEMFEIEPDQSGRSDRIRTRFLGEAALTNALIRLTQGDRPQVGFTTGHGEPSILVKTPGTPGFGFARERLEQVGMQVVEVNLARSIPSDLSVLVVAAPSEPLGADAVARIESFTAGGGRLVILLDSDPTGLESWLKLRGIEKGSGRIVDPVTYFRQPELPLISIGSVGRGEPILGPLAGRMILAPRACPLVLKRLDAASGLPMPLLRTGPSSWAESEPSNSRLTLDPEKDRPGPLVVGARVVVPPPRGSGGEPDPQLVVFSSRNLFDNEVLAVSQANFDLLVSTLAWLQRRPDLSGVSPRTYVARTLSAGPNLRAKLVLLPTCLSVAVIIGLGVMTYLARRD